MIRLTNRSTGHEIRTDEASVEFWSAAGYVKQDEPVKAPAKKAAAKRAPRKSNR